MFLVPLLALGGLVCGSFLALLAEYVPDNGGGGRSPSTCRSCDSSMPTLGLLPIRSNASSCPSCKASVSAARLPIAITTAIVFAVIGVVIGTKWQLIPVLFLAASLISLSAVDFARFRLPDRLVFPSLYIGIAILGVLSAMNGSLDHFVRGLIVMLAYSALLLIPNLIMPSGLAFGDVKLGLLLGLFLGWVADSGIDAARLVVWAYLLGMVFGIVSGMAVGVGRRVLGPQFMPDPDYPIEEGDELVPLLKTQMPFGPALACAALGLIVFSGRVLDGASILV